MFIGERERANLVFQLARFLFVCMSPYRNLLRNSKYTSAKFHVHRVSRMRKYISLQSYGSGVLGQLYYSWQVCALLVWLACI